ncbi:MAG: IS630 family transposase [Thermomicrobiales bacterium]
MPAAANADFVAAMEDVLDVYHRPLDPARPLVCFDEGGKELRDHARAPLPARPGRPAREDYEYVRHGSANLFLWSAPLLGRRGVAVTERRTRLDFADALKALVDVEFPDAERIVPVLDNLDTHHPASLYHRFLPAEAKRIRDRLELHFTPKHGSWLNIAELEFAALKRQCLDRRLPDRAALEHEVAAWTRDRNAAAVRVDWRFTTEDARIKLRHLYPVPEPISNPTTTL